MAFTYLQALLLAHPSPCRVRDIVKGQRPFKRLHHTAQLLIETERLSISVILLFHLHKLLVHATKRLFPLTLSWTMLKHQIKLILPKTDQFRILFPDYRLEPLCFVDTLLSYLFIVSVLLYQLIQLFILIF